jgi:hypothetical protein
MTAQPPRLDLANALPPRPITVRPATTVNPYAAGGIFVVLYAVLAVLWVHLVPDLARDWRLRGDTEIARDVRIEEASCRSWLGFLAFCSITLSETRDATETKTTFRYAFIGRQDQNQITPLRGRTDPSLLSTDAGAGRLWNRGLVAALLLAIPLICIGAVANVVRNARKTRAAFAGLNREDLEPIVVEIERSNALPPRRRMWTYLYEDGGKQSRTFIELPSRARPLFLSEDERWALAVRGPLGTVPLLLDQTLSAMDLTPEEKAAFLEACRAQLPASFRG